ncbi:hypothetical protein SAMN05421721_1112 [Ectothiorhodospira mobilis]|uniref:PH domain-containing protein n=1 Tax=Ectothiorhodospira mobilis TaxID=195064 RepID=A0A1I4RYJ9_ECTMO|nr:hypothetical protein [Ectothiorhodospira mobilis]SFM57309.1 hypothetical protein SAMN05421721_1112 [Ectothiorhodospira mobilis]
MEALPVLIIVAIIAWVIYTKIQARNQLDKLKQSGFQIDHLLNGSVKVAFNDATRKVAFVFRDMSLQYDYTDIKQWQWHWIEKNAVKTNNQLHFTLRDKNRPLIKVGNLSKTEAEHWVAKLDAIINE